MDKLNRQKILNLPNGVTIIRIAAIPIILLLLFTSGQAYPIITAVLFLLVAGTDTSRWISC